MTLHCILSGDLVGSTRLGTEVTDAAMDCLHQAARQIGDWCGEDPRFTRFRGDGWQLYLPLPGLSLHATLHLVASLKATALGAETRIAIGFGTVDRLGTVDLSAAAGEAFELAGKALDTMPGHRRIALEARTILRDWHHALFDLSAWVASRWSPEQATAVALALDPTRQRTQSEIARQLGITRQAVQLRLSGAGWDALQASLDTVRRAEWNRHD